MRVAVVDNHGDALGRGPPFLVRIMEYIMKHSGEHFDTPMRNISADLHIQEMTPYTHTYT